MILVEMCVETFPSWFDCLEEFLPPENPNVNGLRDHTHKKSMQRFGGATSGSKHFEVLFFSLLFFSSPRTRQDEVGLDLVHNTLQDLGHGQGLNLSVILGELCIQQERCVL